MNFTMPSHYARLLSAAAIALSITSCGQNDSVEITEKRVVAPVSTPAGDPGSSASRFGAAPPGAPMQAQAGPAAGPGWAWDKPATWQDASPTQMRPANFKVGPNGEGECYLTVLSGGGGGMLANVNRWRSQMSLGEITQDELNAFPSAEVAGQKAVLVEFDGAYKGMESAVSVENAKMLGAILESGGQSLFVKMVGPGPVIEAERENFKAFCTSLRPGDGTVAQAAPVAGASPSGAMPNDDTHAGFGSAASKTLTWDMPAGWTIGPDKPMREVTFFAGEGDASECFITILGGAGGGAESNINRWMQQMGQPALAADAFAALPTITVLGVPSQMVEISGSYTGMDGVTKENYMMLGLVCTLPDSSVFVKMTGPEAVVKAQKDSFVAFCSSLKKPAAAA